MPHLRLGFSFWIVAALAAAVLSLGASSTAPGLGYLDFPVTAQDEAVYSHAAIRMAETGDWSTPYFLDRMFLYKPPLLYWLSGLAVKLFGVSAWALRLPSILAAALTAALVFAWVRVEGGWVRAGMAAAFLLASPLFLELGRRNMTDALITLTIVAAVWLAARDEQLEQGATLAGLAACVALGILSKSIAGLVPVFIIGAMWLAASKRAPLWRIALAATLGVLAALPWFVYQWEAHRRWFEAEFIGVELLAYGAMAPPQTNEEWALFFYPRRLWSAGPGLCVAMLAGIAGLEAKLRARRGGSALAIAAALIMMSAAIVAYQYHNATYLLPLLPLMAIAGGIWAPAWGLAVAPAAALAAFLYSGSHAPPPHPGGPLFELATHYCEMKRGNDLIVVDIKDDFSVSNLPLAKLRYAIRGAARPTGGFTLDFRSMGVVLPSDEFNKLAEAEPRYAPRLREWGLAGSGAFARVIGWEEFDDLLKLIAANPNRDFLIPLRDVGPPEVIAKLAASPAHRAESPRGGFALLLLASQSEPPRAPEPPSRACRL